MDYFNLEILEGLFASADSFDTIQLSQPNSPDYPACDTPVNEEQYGAGTARAFCVIA